MTGRREGKRAWTHEELQRELERFRKELERAGLRASSVDTYVGRSETPLRWLVGDYRPRGPVGS